MGTGYFPIPLNLDMKEDSENIKPSEENSHNISLKSRQKSITNTHHVTFPG